LDFAWIAIEGHNLGLVYYYGSYIRWSEVK